MEKKPANFFERFFRSSDPDARLWGGYQNHSPKRLIGWAGFGCFLAIIIALLIAALAIAVSFQLARMLFPDSTAFTLQQQVNELNREIQTLKKETR